MRNILIEDRKAKSKSFFLKGRHSVFDSKLLDFIKKNFKKFKKDLRICMHENSAANHHDMIILQQRSNSYPPHKHLKKGETYHMILGKMGCLLFNNNGKVKKMCVLKKGDIFRVPKNTYHTMLPISKYVIYHESKIGPFLKKTDSIFPKWIKNYNKLQHLNKLNKNI
tara:strand:- start:162 stop:662 length:501 start_codon:yes stop_codon:yes gene_type:complete